MPPSTRSRTAPAKVDCTRSPPKKKQACQAARDDNEAPQASQEQRLVEDNCRNFRRTDLRVGDGLRAPRTVPTLLAAGQRVHTPLGGGVVKATKLAGWVVELAARRRPFVVGRNVRHQRVEVEVLRKRLCFLIVLFFSQVF